jgi:signal transduction histidine kinase
VTPLDFMDRTLNARSLPSLPAVAIRGEGVLETFSAILAASMEDLAVRYQIVEIGKGQRLDQWTSQTILGMFGTASLTPTAPAEEPTGPRSAVFFPAKAGDLRAEDRHTVRIALPEDAVQLAGLGPSARGNEALVESYAEASARLSADLADAREERNRAEKRLDQLALVVGALHDVTAGRPLDVALRTVLGVMAEAAGARHASLLLPTPRAFKAAALKGIDEDPLLKARGGARQLLESLAKEVEPRSHLVADSLDLGEALEDPVRPFGALVSVPVRNPQGIQALVFLYCTPDEAVPRGNDLEHLDALARALSAGLDLVSALERAGSAEGLLHLAMAGMLSLRGLEEILTSVLALRDGLADIRRHFETVPALREEFGRITPSLAGALALARSLLTFGREQVQHEVVDVKELLVELRASGLPVDIQSRLGTVLGDPQLIRLGLAILIDHFRRAGVSLAVKAFAEGGQLRIRVLETGSSQGAAPPSAGPASPRPGLPLALVQKIVELHGGKLSPEGGDGALTAVTLTFPLGGS